MVIKILNSGMGFAGIAYNSDKEEKEEAKLLVSENFEEIFRVPGKELDSSDYTEYFQELAAQNQFIKKPQFHVTLSVKGNSQSFDQLAQAGKDYMNYMGYGKVPYLIYGHYDTNNNHVHIISSRVDKEGNKVDHNFERLRSQDFIKKYLGIDYSKELTSIVNDAAKFKVQSVGQYLSVLEQMGVKSVINGDQVEAIRHGRKVESIPLEDIESVISKSFDITRARQISAIFHKYSENLTREEFMKFLKDKFGLNVIFHQAKGKEVPYGFTVIDNKNQAAFKGSQIISLAKLYERFKSVDQKRNKLDLESLLASVMQTAENFSEMREKLHKEGLHLDFKGVVSYRNGKEVFQVSEVLLKEMKYRDRYNLAKSFSTSNRVSKELLGKLFYLRKEDIKGLPSNKRQNRPFDSKYYRNLVAGISSKDLSLKDQLDKLKIDLVEFQGRYFAVDNENKSISEIDIEFIKKEIEDIRSMEPFFTEDKYHHFEKGAEENNLSEQLKLTNVVEMISNLLNYGQEEEHKRKRKKGIKSSNSR